MYWFWVAKLKGTISSWSTAHGIRVLVLTPSNTWLCGWNSNSKPKMVPITFGAWNVRTLLVNFAADRPERRTENSSCCKGIFTLQSGHCSSQRDLFSGRGATHWGWCGLHIPLEWLGEGWTSGSRCWFCHQKWPGQTSHHHPAEGYQRQANGIQTSSIW